MNAANIAARAFQTYVKSVAWSIIAGIPAIAIIYVLTVTHQYYNIVLIVAMLPLFRAVAQRFT